DAITAVDPFSNRSFNTQLGGACSLASFSDDAGASWTPSEACGPLLDHETIGGGPYHAPVPTPPPPAYPGAVHYSAQNGFRPARHQRTSASVDGTSGIRRVRLGRESRPRRPGARHQPDRWASVLRRGARTPPRRRDRQAPDHRAVDTGDGRALTRSRSRLVG